MSYQRVIPRDLFNEANLLKCYGRIYINLETSGLRGVELEGDGEAFDVQQDPGSGSLSIANVVLRVNEKPYTLFRPLNSREAWPLRLVDENETEIAVFAPDGSFSQEMTAFLKAAVEAEVKSGHSLSDGDTRSMDSGHEDDDHKERGVGR